MAGSHLSQSSMSRPMQGLNFFYAVFVSILFGGYASDRAADANEDHLKSIYFMASFVMNFPMAWDFSEKTMTIIFNEKKKDSSYYFSMVLGFLLSAWTTIGGIEVAAESVEGLSWCNRKACHTPMMLLSIVNTFTTRFVGSTVLSRGLIHFLFNLCKKHSDSGDTLPLLNNQGPSADNQNEKKYSCNDFLVFVFNLLIGCIFVANMMPVWMYLSVGGLKKLGDKHRYHLEKQSVLVVLSSLSSELFYLNSALKLMPVIQKMYKKHKKFLGDHVFKRDACQHIYFFLIMSLSFIMTYVAYLSGGGYAHSAQSALGNHQAENGSGFNHSIRNDTLCRDGRYFDPMTNSLWFSWLGGFLGAWTCFFIPKAYPSIIQVTAGVIVNGQAFVDFFSGDSWLAAQPKKLFSNLFFKKQGAQDEIRLADLSVMTSDGQGDAFPSYGSIN